jgi:hypothetical protein
MDSNGIIFILNFINIGQLALISKGGGSWMHTDTPTVTTTLRFIHIPQEGKWQPPANTAMKF